MSGFGATSPSVALSFERSIQSAKRPFAVPVLDYRSCPSAAVRAAAMIGSAVLLLADRPADDAAGSEAVIYRSTGDRVDSSDRTAMVVKS